MARLVKRPFLNRLMRWAIMLVVPRHRIGVVLVGMDEANRVLMLRHVFHPYTPWGLPGGWLGRRESPAEGVLRELKEETGLTAVLDSVILIDRQPDPHHMDIAYLGRIQKGNMQLSGEIIEADWFPLDALPEPLLKFHRDALTAVQQKFENSGEPLFQETAVHHQGTNITS